MKVVINIDVPALVPAIDFYSLAFGLVHTRTLDSDVAELTGTAITIYLLQKATGSPAATESPIARRYERHWTPVHFDVVVSDLDDAVRRVTAAGARLEAGPIEWHGSSCMTFADPFGHGFCLLQFVNGKSYED